MSLVNQAEFARMHGVSRKTITTWKQRGYLVFAGSEVDVERSNAMLRGAGKTRDGVTGTRAPVTSRARTVTSTPVAAVVGADRVTAYPAVDVGDGSWINQTGASVGVADAVSHLALMADGSTMDFIHFSLRHLPPEVVLPMATEFLAMQRQGAIEVADEACGLPAGLPSWALHRLFRGAVMVQHELDEALRDAALWKAARSDG